MQRFRRRPPEPAPEPATGASATGDAPTESMPAAAAHEDLPAGQDPDDGQPSFRHRARARRRLRYLRRVRELGFRDLGGLVFDQHRFERGNEQLVQTKVEALAAIDRELRALEHVLADRRPVSELREPGVSVCARCGALHGSDARFCPSCGTPQRGARTIAGVGEALPGPGTLAPTAQPVAASEPAPGTPSAAEAPTAAHEATRSEQ